MKYIDHNNCVFVTITYLIFCTYHYIKCNKSDLIQKGEIHLNISTFLDRTG